jgi:peroxiredoxin
MILVSTTALYILVNQGLNVIWIGASLTVAPLLFFLIKILLLNDTPRTSANLPIISIITLFGFAISLISFIFGGSTELLRTNSLGFFAALIATFCYGLYLFWYSQFTIKRSDILTIGSKLIDFELFDLSGKSIPSKDFAGSHTILLFFRGNWCPLCMAQIKEVVDYYHELEQLNTKIVLVSPQPPEHSKKLAKKFNVNMHFLTDRNNNAAHILGIGVLHGLPKGLELLGYDSETVLPTVIITDKIGIIRYCDLTSNYRVRPHPKAFVEIIKQTESIINEQ